MCDDCNKTRKSKKEMPKTNCDINNQKLNELKADFDQMHQQMNNMAQGLYHQIEELAKQVSSNKEETEDNQREKSYAEKLKTKNTLVIKSNDGDNKALQKKKAIMSVKAPLANSQINWVCDSPPSQSPHIAPRQTLLENKNPKKKTRTNNSVSRNVYLPPGKESTSISIAPSSDVRVRAPLTRIDSSERHNLLQEIYPPGII